MSDLEIEKLGGIAGFGPSSHLRSRGRISYQALSDADKATVDQLFAQGGVSSRPGTADEFRYQITRQTPTGPQTIEVAEHAVPDALAKSVRDELK
jgi:hypothetical protein